MRGQVSLFLVMGILLMLVTAAFLTIAQMARQEQVQVQNVRVFGLDNEVQTVKGLLQSSLDVSTSLSVDRWRTSSATQTCYEQHNGECLQYFYQGGPVFSSSAAIGTLGHNISTLFSSLVDWSLLEESYVITKDDVIRISLEQQSNNTLVTIQSNVSFATDTDYYEVQHLTSAALLPLSTISTEIEQFVQFIETNTPTTISSYVPTTPFLGQICSESHESGFDKVTMQFVVSQEAFEVEFLSDKQVSIGCTIFA